VLLALSAQLIELGTAVEMLDAGRYYSLVEDVY
jgi:hypothetical protein